MKNVCISHQKLSEFIKIFCLHFIKVSQNKSVTSLIPNLKYRSDLRKKVVYDIGLSQTFRQQSFRICHVNV